MASIFVSHASEDKADFVRPLAHALKRYGLKVWYDEFSLHPGNSLRRSIDKGLAECSTGVVVFSKAFFAKEWPQRELDALFTAEVAGRTQLLPIWYGISAADIAAISPLLADRIAINGDIGFEQVASQIADLVPSATKISGAALAQMIGYFRTYRFYEGEALFKGCQYRFLQIQAVNEEYMDILEQACEHLSDDEVGDGLSPEIEIFLSSECKRLLEKYRIPEDVYLNYYDEPENENNLGWWMDVIGQWASGTLSREDSLELIHELDEQLDLDYLYILLGIPNFLVSLRHRPLLHEAAIVAGSWFEDETNAIECVCHALRALDEDS